MEDLQESLKALGGRCSAVDSNTLYLLSDSNLLSLRLEKNATVSEEASPAQNVTAPACVKAGDAMFVIGGGDTPDDYMGLQKYTFASGAWETLSLAPGVDAFKTRTNHSVAYLEASEEILVYAGSTTDAPSLLSSQTFLLSTQPPYNLRSFVSFAPPATEPILLPWNSSHAVMMGGETANTAIWLFGPDQGWQQLATNLSEPLNPDTKGIIIDGTDGSKVVQLYDMSTSPNTVSNVVLLGVGEEIAPPGQTVGDESSSRKRKRDLTLADWPAYNSTNAPTSTRTDYSIAQNAEGLVVIAGGSEREPIVLYNREENSWVDSEEFFGANQQVRLGPTSTASTSASPTASSTAEPTASTSAAPSPGMSSHDRMMQTLGITLGVLCGIAAIFIIALLLLRWRKLKAKRKAGYLEEKNNNDNDPNRMSFADRGASFMKEAGMSVDDLAPPKHDWQPGKDHNAHSSLAIITGKYNSSRNTNDYGPKASFESTAQLVKNKNGHMVPSENLEMMDIGEKSNGSKLAVPGAAVLKGNSLDPNTRAERKRSSGWSKYFATTQPTGPNGTSHIPSVYVKPGAETNSTSDFSQDDGAKSHTSQIPSSKPATPLTLDFAKIGEGHRLSTVATGSPSFFNSQDEFASRGSHDIPEGQRGLIVDPNDSRRSQATSISSYGNRSTIDSTATSEYYNESGHTPWTPMSATGNQMPGQHERETSSVYTASIYDPSGRRPSRGKSTGFFPGAGTTYVKSPKTKLAAHSPTTANWPAPPKLPFAAKSAEARDSTASDITVFPSGRDSEDSKEVKGGRKPTNDMSWVQLG